ncbi:MAG: FecR domain-containing protein [Candidatus Gracilibacteria bacterium]|nr:FecR domain-containing protein [Candidatus Gracilibacteria bacterium]
MKKKIKLKNKKILGFSFVELIVVISIIALITIIGVSINTNYTEKSKNTKITGDIETIKNALESYKNDTNSLPLPSGNLKYYDDSANYIHYDDIKAFGVYGNISQNTLPKKYLDNLPLDPRTNQFYAYGKTLTGGLLYELSGVNKTNGNFESKVIGNYSGDINGPYNLIREYNGPDFVYDKSLSNFPYNPSEKIITGKIGIFSGIIFVNGTKIDTNRIKDNELIAGDTVEVATGSTTEIYYSDGTKSVLGDPIRTSKLNLTKLAYKDQYNLITKIQLALDLGTIWCSTSKLDKDSEFEIYTTNTEVAVRGTIFGVTKSGISKTIPTEATVVKGKISVTKIAPMDITNVESNITTNSITYISTTTDATASTIPVKLYIPTSAAISTTTGITPILVNDDGLTNIKPILKSVYNGEINLEFPSSFSGTNKKVFANSTIDKTMYSTFSGNLLTIKYLTGSNSIKVCDSTLIKCTIPITVTSEINYNNKSITCNSYETYFDGLGCIPIDQDLYNSGFTLVAYAPYDTKGDLNMYKPDGSHITYSNGGNITFDDTYPDNKGIKIMSATSDWLAYSGSELGLGPDFAIEMSLKGETLKRNTDYFLFSEYLLNIRVYKQSGYLKYYLDGTNYNSINNYTNLIDNNFYNIISKKIGSKQYLNTNYYSSFTGAIGSTILSGDIYIGTSKYKTYQLNDIIDFVKIYKK